MKTVSTSEWEKLWLKCQHCVLETKCDFFSQPPDAAVPPETESARSSCEAPGGTWRYCNWSSHLHILKNDWLNLEGNILKKYIIIHHKRWFSTASNPIPVRSGCSLRALKTRWEESYNSWSEQQHVLGNKEGKVMVFVVRPNPLSVRITVLLMLSSLLTAEKRLD